MASRRPPGRPGPDPELPVLSQPHRAASPFGPAHRPRQLRADPAAPARPQMLKLAASGSLGRPSCAQGAGDAHTPPFLWADPRLRPPRKRCSLQLRSLLLHLCSASENLLFCARTSKIGGRKRGFKKNGCGSFKTCPLPFPFPLSAPFHGLVPKYRGRRGAKRHRRRGKEGTEKERSKE